jgi:Flp pilus assembly pilin Flp
MEYALIATLLSIMILAGVTNIGTKLSTFFTALGPKIK